MHNFTKEDIKEYHNVFEEAEVKSIFNYVKQAKWEWGHQSIPGNQDATPPFWSMHLGDNQFFTEYLVKKILNITGDDLIPEFCYANGHTYGLPGGIHQDGSHIKNRTFLFYANTNWLPQWNGKTGFILGENDYHFVMPEYNKAVYFPGIVHHFAEEPTRTFGGLRITIAWKLRLK